MRERLTLDTKLLELLRILPQAKEILSKYGYQTFEEEDIESIVVDKLTIKGFCRLMDLDEDAQESMWQEIQSLYREVWRSEDG